MNDSPATGLLGTLAAAAAVFGAFAATLAFGPAAGPLAPPAVAVLGLGLAAGRGAWGGAGLIVWAGVLHAAAADVPAGPCVAAGAVLAAGLRWAHPANGRRWLLAGGLAWAWAGAASAVAGGGWGGAGPLAASLALGAACGGVAAAARFDRHADAGWA